MDRREHPRYMVCLEIEVREATSCFSSRGTTTDASLGGCYIATIFPLAPGSVVTYRLWVGDQPIQGSATVQTCHPGVGMGLKFNDLSTEAVLVLDQYLRNSTSIPMHVAFSQVRSFQSGK
ncbi:MAG: PilZ domain-containing protein [Acidobacteria bacterium]|nr:PilZ domain-containing protein [Acidobacteriota bacterium]